MTTTMTMIVSETTLTKTKTSSTTTTQLQHQRLEQNQEFDQRKQQQQQQQLHKRIHQRLGQQQQPRQQQQQQKQQQYQRQQRQHQQQQHQQDKQQQQQLQQQQLQQLLQQLQQQLQQQQQRQRQQQQRQQQQRQQQRRQQQQQGQHQQRQQQQQGQQQQRLQQQQRQQKQCQQQQCQQQQCEQQKFQKHRQKQRQEQQIVQQQKLQLKHAQQEQEEYGGLSYKNFIVVELSTSVEIVIVVSHDDDNNSNSNKMYYTISNGNMKYDATILILLRLLLSKLIHSILLQLVCSLWKACDCHTEQELQQERRRQEQWQPQQQPAGKNQYKRIPKSSSFSFSFNKNKIRTHSIFGKGWMLLSNSLFIVLILDTISTMHLITAKSINALNSTLLSDNMLHSGTRQLNNNINSNNDTYLNLNIHNTLMQYELDCDTCMNRNLYTINAILHYPAPTLSLLSIPDNDNMNYYQSYINSWKQQIMSSMNQSANDMGIKLIIDFIAIQPSDNDNNGIDQMKSLIFNSINENTNIHGLIVSIPDNNLSIEEFYTNSIINHTKPIYVMNLLYNENIQSYNLQGSVSYNPYQIGEYAAYEFISSYYDDDATMMTTDTNTSTKDTNTNNTIRLAAFVQMNLLPSSSLRQQQLQYESFRRIFQSNNNLSIVDLIYIDNPYDKIHHEISIEQLFNDSCQYDIILLQSELSLPYTVVAKANYNCSNTQIGVVDMSSSNPVMYDYLSKKSILFSIDSQIHLQSSLLIILLSLNVLTGIQLPIPSSTSFMTASKNKSNDDDGAMLSSYLTSPVVIRQDSIPTDTYQNFRNNSFPICDSSSSLSSDSTDDWNENDDDINHDFNGSTNSVSRNKYNNNNARDHYHHENVDCIDRSWIRIGAVVHGDTSDSFWDPVFASASQAANDMNIQLDMIRFQPQSTNDILHQKMSTQIRTLCESNIDGIFVTIPNETLIDSIQLCQALNIPVISINTGKDISEQLNLLKHIGQDEYIAGKKAAELMIAGGMKYGYCVDHSKQIVSVVQRCLGFQDTIKLMNDSNIQYMGMHQVPVDNRAQYKAVVESIISETIYHNDIDVDNNNTIDDSWNGIGILGMGPAQIEGLRDVATSHPNAIAGTFDVSPEISNGLKDKWLKFAIDQQHYYQGNLPVYLLTHLAYTKQSLLNRMIETGPGVVTDAPSDAKIICESNFYEVCLPYPTEDMNMIPIGYLALGYTMFAIITCMCVCILIWMYLYRHKHIVSVGQPNLLTLVVIGCFLSSLSIMFMGVQTTSDGNNEEEEQEDLGTRYMTTTSASTMTSTTIYDGNYTSINFVNASCMAVPWLYGIGFILTFSALFAKIQRVKLIYVAGLKMQRRTIGIKDVSYVMAFLTCIELAILMCWQIIDPLQWYREVLESDRGYPTDSVGKCTSTSKDGWIFVAIMFAFHVMCLLYALILCWQTKDLNSDFAESSYISLAVVFMFQVMILVIPVSILVINSTSIFYFLKVCAVFLQNSSVLSLLFVPKMFKLYSEQELDQNDKTMSITDASARDIGIRATYSQTSLKRVLTSSNLCANSLKKYGMTLSNIQFTMIRESMHNNSSNEPNIVVPDIDPNDMKVIESKLKRSVRFASVLTNYDLSNYFGPITDENRLSKTLDCISEAINPNTEAFNSSSSSVFKFFSEHNVPISDDVMPIMDDNNMPIEIDIVSISNSSEKCDDDTSEGSYDLFADILEQKMTQERYHYSSRLALWDSHFWIISEEGESRNIDENYATDGIEPKQSIWQQTNYMDFHTSKRAVTIDDDDNDDDDDDDDDGIQKSVSSSIISTSDDSQKNVNYNLNKKKNSCNNNEHYYLISKWKEFGFKSKEQAKILMSIASTTIAPEERRKLISKFENISE